MFGAVYPIPCQEQKYASLKQVSIVADNGLMSIQYEAMARFIIYRRTIMNNSQWKLDQNSNVFVSNVTE